MTDHIPADKLDQAREWAEWIIQADSQVEVDPDLRGAAEVILDLLPDPTPRTLADMTREEREACQWMQATFRAWGGQEVRVVITKIYERTADIVYHGGTTSNGYHDRLTPLPHLPRLEWPASVPVTEGTPEPAPTHPEDVKPDPQPGEAWLIEYEGQRYQAIYWHSPIYAHWTFLYDWERGPSTVESTEATPVSRLVPEQGGVS